MAALLTEAAAVAGGDAWNPVRFLEGEWIGSGSGEPGQSSGGAFSFAFDLQQKIFVRRSYAEYAATANRPAFRHDDLLVLYEENGLHGIYFDSEGHVIRYAVHARPSGVEFLSDPAPGMPRFRFTYIREGAGAVRFSFDMSSPERPGEFKTYVAGKARRK